MHINNNYGCANSAGKNVFHLAGFLAEDPGILVMPYIPTGISGKILD